ncbi:MAG: hypothetical protein HC889_18810 [Synechococcaceae cyanobacterium SM1_2_3]|nr:hypothetical protein [Synechococcaceae cyanobacterium SM1_2_3]
MFIQRAADRRRRMGGAAAPSLSAQVEAILAGTNGFAIDPTDASTKWQTDDTSTPWTTDGQVVGRIQAKWGLAPPAYSQVTPANRPLGTSRYLEGDGVNDSLIATAAVPFLQKQRGLCNLREASAQLGNSWPLDFGLSGWRRCKRTLLSGVAAGAAASSRDTQVGPGRLAQRQLSGWIACPQHGLPAWGYRGLGGNGEY